MIKKLYIQNSCFFYHVIMVFFASFGLSAQDYYVAPPPFGNDSNTGTEAAPFATINKGIFAVQPGGTVYVMNGTYTNQNYGTAYAHLLDGSLSQNMNNPPVVTINKSGTVENYITIRNYPDHNPKIMFDGRGGILISNPQSYIIIEGFEIEGPAASIDYDMAIADRDWKVKCDQEGLSYTHNYFSGFGIWSGFSQGFLHNHIIVRNNIVHHTTGSGIRFNDSDHITIENNIVYNTTWWTSNASSAIVFAETKSQSSTDNGDDIKMIIRGNTVYNNWNRIPFYMTQGVVPPNGNPPSGDYGNANYSTILDGQGLYVTRSDDDYYGTFLFENNLCVNNGKNGVNFDRSEGSSALIRNNTIYFNGAHEIIQDISVSEGNPPHRGQKVAGIKSNFFRNVTVVNNIVVTREYDFFAMQLLNQNASGTVKVANNNIFVNGKLPGYTNSENKYLVHSWVRDNNQIINDIDFNISNHVDPISFVSSPAIVNGPIDMSSTDFRLQSHSPAKDAGNKKHTPATDILGNPRPVTQSDAISSSSFETSLDGWTNFGSTVTSSTEAAKSGSKSLKTSARTKNYHSPRIFLNSLLEVDKSYTFYVWVKLAEGSGTVQLTVKSTVNGATTKENVDTYTNLASETASANDWVLLTDNYTHTQNDQSFLYVKGPPVINEVGVEYYIDDFSLVDQGTGEVDFSTVGNIVDIGAYEYQSQPLSTSYNPVQANSVYAFPNPAKDMLTLINLTNEESITIYDLLGRKQAVYQHQQRKTNQLKLNVSMLDTGIYFIHVSNAKGKIKSIRFIKK